MLRWLLDLLHRTPPAPEANRQTRQALRKWRAKAGAQELQAIVTELRQHPKAVQLAVLAKLDPDEAAMIHRQLRRPLR